MRAIVDVFNVIFANETQKQLRRLAKMLSCYGKTLTALFLATSLAACNVSSSSPATQPENRLRILTQQPKEPNKEFDLENYKKNLESRNLTFMAAETCSYNKIPEIIKTEQNETKISEYAFDLCTAEWTVAAAADILADTYQSKLSLLEVRQKMRVRWILANEQRIREVRASRFIRPQPQKIVQPAGQNV